MQSMIILALCLIVAVSAQNYGCSVPQGREILISSFLKRSISACMALNGMNICPNNQGCVDNNSVCCNYGDIINKDQRDYPTFEHFIIRIFKFQLLPPLLLQFPIASIKSIQTLVLAVNFNI